MNIAEIRDKLTEITLKLYKEPNQDFYREKVAEFRGISEKTLEDIKSFYIEDPIKDILPIVGEDIFLNPVYGFFPKENMYVERFILPVWSTDDKVMGFIGYDNLSNYRYILSETMGFKKKTSVYGLNTLDRALKMDYLIIVEGHFDYLRLYSLGYPVVAMQGTSVPEVLKEIVKPLSGVIILTDNDNAGISALKYVKRIHPKASVIHLPKGYDPDQYLQTPEHCEMFKCAVGEIRDYYFMKPYVKLNI